MKFEMQPMLLACDDRTANSAAIFGVMGDDVAAMRGKK